MPAALGARAPHRSGRPLWRRMWACCYFRESTFFSALGRSFFDDAASTETQAHRSNGPYQRISLRHLLCSATICSTPMQGTRSWDRVYCCPTAAKPPVERAGHSTFLRYLQVKRRADERTRTAYPCSLRVITQALQGFARGCKSPISKRLSSLRVAACCTVLRFRWYQSGIKTSDSYSLTAGPMACPRDLRSHNPSRHILTRPNE